MILVLQREARWVIENNQLKSHRKDQIKTRTLMDSTTTLCSLSEHKACYFSSLEKGQDPHTYTSILVLLHEALSLPFCFRALLGEIRYTRIYWNPKSRRIQANRLAFGYTSPEYLPSLSSFLSLVLAACGFCANFQSCPVITTIPNMQLLHWRMRRRRQWFIIHCIRPQGRIKDANWWISQAQLHFERKNTFTLKVECVGESSKYFSVSGIFFPEISSFFQGEWFD